MRVEHRHVVAHGTRCHALEAGSGPPLVLLHGTAIDSAALTYGPSLPHLALRHHVLALDWPGYGRSEHPRALPTMDDMVSLLAAFLDEVGLERVHLAGFSMGAAIGLGFALRSPDRVATLTAIGAYGLDGGLPVPILPFVAMRLPWLTCTRPDVARSRLSPSATPTRRGAHVWRRCLPSDAGGGLWSTPRRMRCWTIRGAARWLPARCTRLPHWTRDIPM